jgi:hypothetical protein
VARLSAVVAGDEPAPEVQSITCELIDRAPLLLPKLHFFQRGEAMVSKQEHRSYQDGMAGAGRGVT